MKTLLFGLAGVLLAGGTVPADVPQEQFQVEIAVKPGEAAKGERIRFDLVLTNTGPKVASDVTIKATLSSGLRYENGPVNGPVGDTFEFRLDKVDAGQRLTLDPLIVDAIARGEQSCSFVVSSSGAAKARSTRKVIVKQ